VRRLRKTVTDRECFMNRRGLALLLAIAAAAYVARDPIQQAMSVVKTWYVPQQQVSPAPQPKPVQIATGIIRRAKNRPGVANFNIEASAMPNYVVKLIRADTGSEEMLIYVKGGETFRTTVALGSYRIWLALGNDWYGEEHYFGKQTAYSTVKRKLPESGEEVDVFRFFKKGNTTYGQTIILKRSLDGTIETPPISEKEFRKNQK
jgi:hypothetical protein